MADSNQDLGNKLAQNDKNNQGKWMQESTDSWDTSWSEKDLDGNLIGVNENANTLETIVNIQESIFIQTEQVEKVDDERQQAEAKAKDDIVSTVSTNGKAIADLKLRAGGWNQKDWDHFETRANQTIIQPFLTDWTLFRIQRILPCVDIWKR